LGLVEQQVRSLFVSQATRLTPVTDEPGLRAFQAEWRGFTPRQVRRGEVVPEEREVPFIYKQANQMLCETAVDLIGTDDKLSWQYSISRVEGQIMQLHPVGRNLALHSESLISPPSSRVVAIARRRQNLPFCWPRRSFADRVAPPPLNPRDREQMPLCGVQI
jgi:hypothetical protein